MGRMLHDRDKLLRVYTQNIDSLESAAGLPTDKIVAAHGNFDSARVVSLPLHLPIHTVTYAHGNFDSARAIRLSSRIAELPRRGLCLGTASASAEAPHRSTVSLTSRTGATRWAAGLSQSERCARR